MKKLIFLAIIIMMISFQSVAQTDTTKTIDLLNDIVSAQSDSLVLLPDKMLITQRLLWGEKGLMRNFKCFELSADERSKELDMRRFMLVSHQTLGVITMAGMIAQGIVGTKLYNGNRDMRDIHEGLAVGINTCYWATAGLLLFAPPKMLSERKGYSSIKVHRWLAVVHVTSMIATNVLAGQLEQHPDYRKYHRAAAITAFGSFAAAMIVVKF